MARLAKPTLIAKSAGSSRPRGRPPALTTSSRSISPKQLPRVSGAKLPDRQTAARKQVVAAPSRTPMVTKDELRAQIEKLERANSVLRSKNREAVRIAKTASARVKELEDLLTDLEQAKATEAKSDVKRMKSLEHPGTKPTKPKRGRGLVAARDLSNAVPEGPEEPGSNDQDAETLL